MGKERLLQALPPYKGNNLLISGHQSVSDIMREVAKSHVAFARDYDQIAGEYLRSSLIDVCRGLFYDCKQFAPYYEEPSKMQTTRSPAAFLEVSEYIGADCKHYAGYIAGVLDALGRMLRKPIDWVYRFAAYRGKKEYGHVFVVVNPGTGNEIWIDPVLAVFNQPYPVPTKFVDKKIDMSLNRISGVGDTGYRSTTTVYRGGRTMGEATAVSAGIDAVVPGLGSGIAQAADQLPDGGLKDFLNGFLKDPIGSVLSLVKGRTYTIGDYQVGEVYMRNILGFTQVQNNRQVPDSYVAQAWMVLSALLGVRIRTIEDIHTLYNAAVDGGGAQQYLDRNRTQTQDISLEAAQRARNVLTLIGVPRDQKWPMYQFASVPYIYPLPGAVQNENFSGIHPALNIEFYNGYPTNFVGDRYVSQVNQTLQPPVPSGTSTGVNAGTNTGGGTATTNTGGNQTASLLGANAAPLLIGGGLLLLVAANSGKSKPRASMGAVRGKKSDHSGLLLLLLVGGAGIALASKKSPAATSPGGTVTPGTIPVNTGSPVTIVPGIAYDQTPVYSPPNPPGYVSPDPTLVKPAYGGGGQIYTNPGIDYMPTDKSYQGASLAPTSQTEYVNFG